MPRNLIVHIGLAKTGSTSIQRMLFELRGALARYGIFIPATGCPPRLCCHNNVAHSLSGAADYRPHLGGWAELTTEIATATSRTILISAEAFTTDHNSGIVDRLAQLAASKDLHTRILAYIRPQHELLESGYSHFIATRMGTATFDEYVANKQRHNDLDFNSILKPWRDAFTGGVSVFPMERSRMPKGLLSHFLEALGVATHGASPDTVYLHENVRIGAKELEVRRLANLAMSGLGLREMRKRRARLRFLPALLADAPFVGMNDRQVRETIDYYNEPNSQFARAFGIDDTGVLFRDRHDDRARQPNRAQWTDLTDGEMRIVTNYLRSVSGIHLEVSNGAPQCDPLPSAVSMKKWWWRPRIARLKVGSWVTPIRQRLQMRRTSRRLSIEAQAA